MTSARSTSVELPANPSSPASARAFISTALRKCEVAPETVDIARLLTSELVTNAVVHARTPMVVSVRVTDRRVRIEVEDRDVSAAQPRGSYVTDDRGRGLTIVSRLARDWGVERHADRKTVWFELRATRA
jgi:anti-sigma regulatory factor (Ser/Thr protein kinase)